MEAGQVGREIRRIREAKGLSQTKVAAAADMGPSGLSQIETGVRNPSAVTLHKIANALGLEVADLFPKEQASLPFDNVGEQRREPSLIDDANIVALLHKWGHETDEEYVAALRDFDPDIDLDGIPRGVEQAVEGLERVRDELLAELRNPANYKKLFPQRSSFSKADVIGKTHIQGLRSYYASQLRTEVRRVYNRRILALVNFSQELFDAGTTEGFLIPSRRSAIVERARHRMLEAAFAGHEAG